MKSLRSESWVIVAVVASSMLWPSSFTLPGSQYCTKTPWKFLFSCLIQYFFLLTVPSPFKIFQPLQLGLVPTCSLGHVQVPTAAVFYMKLLLRAKLYQASLNLSLKDVNLCSREAQVVFLLGFISVEAAVEWMQEKPELFIGNTLQI